MDNSDNRVLVFGDFMLDPGAAELRHKGMVVPLEPQVFDLIHYFASHPARVVTRDDIIESVWHGRIVSDSAISTRINAARKALGDDGSAQRVIKTIHGRGFRFELDTDGASPEEDIGPNDEKEPLEVRYCTTPDGVSIAFAGTGEGLPLIKTASFMTHLQHDSEGVLFAHWIYELSKHYRYVRYDERGNGLSDWEIESFSFEAMVQDLETVIDTLGYERFALLGVSQGASVALEYARRYPERVGCLILYGGYAAGWQHSKDEAFKTTRNALLDLTRVTWGSDNPAGRQAYAALYIPDGTPEQHSEFMRLQQITTTPENAYRILKTFAQIDVRDILPEISVPTLVMHCRGDAPVPFEAGRTLAASIPDARLVMLEGNNHIIQKGDAGWPRFMSEIRHFMAENLGR